MKALAIIFVLFVSAEGLIIECEFGEYPACEGVECEKQSYLCFVLNITPSDDTEGSINSIQVRGIHSEGKTNADVESLCIYHQKLPNRFPKNIGNVFPNLSVLDWYNGSLPSVTAEDLETLPNLKVLSLSMHELVSLNSDLLKHNKKLEWVNFRDNLIEHVGTGLLASLSHLRYALFHGNPCINFNATTPDELEVLKAQLLINCPPLEGLEANKIYFVESNDLA